MWLLAGWRGNLAQRFFYIAKSISSITLRTFSYQLSLEDVRIRVVEIGILYPSPTFLRTAVPIVKEDVPPRWGMASACVPGYFAVTVDGKLPSIRRLL